MPLLNRTASTNNNDINDDYLYCPAHAGPVVAGEVKICKVHLFLVATRLLLPRAEEREAGESANFTQLQCFFYI